MPQAVDKHHCNMFFVLKAVRRAEAGEEVAHVLPICHAKDGGSGLRLVERFSDSPGGHFISVGTQL